MDAAAALCVAGTTRQVESLGREVGIARTGASKETANFTCPLTGSASRTRQR